MYSTLMGKRRGGRRHRRGKTVVVLALSLPLIMTLAAYAVGLTYLQLTRMKLQTIVDASAVAAADHYSATDDYSSSREAAKQVASGNEIQGAPLQLTDDDIEFGRYEKHGDEWEFAADEQRPNAVRVTATVVANGGVGPARVLEWIDSNLDVEVTRESVATQINRDIALVTDRSYSMGFEPWELLPGEPLPGVVPVPRNVPLGWVWCLAAPLNSKWRGLETAVDDFLAELALTTSDEQVALVSFAEEGRIEHGLTLDYAIIRQLIQLLTATFCGGPANMQSGIEEGIVAVNASQRPETDKVLLLLTGSRASLGTPVDAATDAAQAGITVHVVSIGSDIDGTLMQNIASAGGGRYWHADTVQELQAILKGIARSARVVTIQPT